MGLGLGALRNANWASEAFSLLVFVSIVWQLIGLGYLNVVTTENGLLLTSLFVLLLAVYLLSARLGPAPVALSMMAVALMLTPYYYLSISFVVAAAALGGPSSIAPVSATFISTLTPFLVIENGIYLPAASRGAPPIVFSYLSDVASNLAPALPGLNVFLTGLPQNVLSQYAPRVAQFVTTGQADVLVIPIVLLGLVFSASASLAAFLSPPFGRLSSLLKTSGSLDAFAPFVGGLVTSVTFVVLIVILASPSLGGYQTSLASAPTDVAFLLTSSLVVGLTFTGRELAVRRMERLEIAKSQLSGLLSVADRTIANSRAVAGTIAKEAPTVDVKAELHTLEEHASLVADMKKGMGTAGYETLTGWAGDLQGRILPSVESMPEALRIKVINELSSLHALIAAYNNILAEARAANRFPLQLAPDGTLSMVGAVNSYREVTTGIRTSAAALFAEYETATGAFNSLLNREEMTPPVNSSYLFDTGDYLTGMKLIAEEYWANFRATCKEEMEVAVSAVATQALRLESLLDEEARNQVRLLVGTLSDAEPAHSAAYLANLEKLRLVLRGEVERWKDDAERLEKLIKSLTPGATKVISFESLDQSGKLRDLLDRLDKTKASMVDLTLFMEDAVSTLTAHRDKVRADERSLITLSQYPVAKKLIEGLFRDRGKVPVADLPFQHDAAVTFAKLFTMTHGRASFDYENEELVTKGA